MTTTQCCLESELTATETLFQKVLPFHIISDWISRYCHRSRENLPVV